MKEPTSKRRYARADAIVVARELIRALKPVTLRLCIAGSLRRGKPDVGDVEVLYMPACEERQIDLVHVGQVDLAAARIERLLNDGVLDKRVSAEGGRSWGPKNKYALHRASGIPVDLFAATEANWWNYLVDRTGPKESNVRICQAAQRKGWHWEPYGPGFVRGGPLAGPRERVAVTSEEEVFAFVGLPYKPPHLR